MSDDIQDSVKYERCDSWSPYSERCKHEKDHPGAHQAPDQFGGRYWYDTPNLRG